MSTAGERGGGDRDGSRTGPPLIGLTGGIGAGKSEALSAFERLGAATLSTDAVVHELLGTGELRERLIARWGADVAPGGEVDRARVAEVVFGRSEELRWLEGELHPRVGERVARWRDSLGDDVPLAVVEVPLLFEAGMEDVFDAVVCVIAEDGVRERRSGSLSGFAGRGERQLSQDEKAARSDHVVRNEGSRAELEASLRDLFDSLTGAGPG